MRRKKPSSSNKNRGAIFGAALLASVMTAASWAGGPGTTGGNVLSTQVSARAIGMGGAFTAVSDDVAAIHWNPAGLAMVQQQQISTMYLKGVVDDNTEFLGYALPLPPELSIAESGVSAVGVSLLFSQLGTIEVPRTDGNGLLVDDNTISAGSDQLYSATYSTLISREGPSFVGPEEHYIGVTGRYLVSNLAQSNTARTAAFDVGYINIWKTPGLRWGFMAKNLGADLKYKTVGDPLPITYSVGAAWQRAWPEIAAQPLTISLDGVLDREGNKTIHTGLEYWAAGMAALRLGYQGGGTQAGGLTAGVGAKISDLEFGQTACSLMADYGFMMMGDLGNTHRISLTLGFGGASSKSATSPSRRNYMMR